ncbi:hypothetical protein D3C86_1135200 [compost metagenome]
MREGVADRGELVLVIERGAALATRRLDAQAAQLLGGQREAKARGDVADAQRGGAGRRGLVGGDGARGELADRLGGGGGVRRMRDATARRRSNCRWLDGWLGRRNRFDVLVPMQS